MADLVFRCFGGAPNTAYLHTMPDVLTPAGRVKVDSTLQVIGHPYMYALGDLTDINEPKLGLNIGPQAAVLAQNLKDAAAGKPPRKQYTPSKGSVMMVTLGEKDGVAQLPFGVVGGFLPRIKARDLLSGQAWQRMNVIAPK